MTPLDEQSDDRPPALAHLAETRPMPVQLEDRVVASLHASGALRRPLVPTSVRIRFAASLLAASLAFFLVGRFTASPSRAVPVATTEARWMLLLYEDQSFRGPAAGQEQAYMDEYRGWAVGLRAAGTLVDGAPLDPGGVLVTSAASVAEPADLETPGVGRLAGYFIVVAPTLERAAAIAATCPHVKYQGRIAIRPVVAG